MSEQVLNHHLAPRRGIEVPGVSHAVALLVSAALLASAQEAPLPALGGAAVFLMLAVEQDVRRMRIPNWLTLPALLGALGYAGFAGGLLGLGTALFGALTGFAILFVPFLLRWLGAGDVKAVMVLGALWGAPVLLPVLWWMVVAGGLLALAVLITRGGFLDLLARWRDSARITFATRSWTYFQPQAGSVAAGGVPFAVAIGLGAAAFQLWGTPWL